MLKTQIILLSDLILRIFAQYINMDHNNLTYMDHNATSILLYRRFTDISFYSVPDMPQLLSPFITFKNRLLTKL